jgi:hypothetical protein
LNTKQQKRAIQSKKEIQCPPLQQRLRLAHRGLAFWAGVEGNQRSGGIRKEEEKEERARSPKQIEARVGSLLFALSSFSLIGLAVDIIAATFVVYTTRCPCIPMMGRGEEKNSESETIPQTPTCCEYFCGSK